MDDPSVKLQSKAEAHWDKTDPVMAQLSRENPLAPTQFWNADPFEALVDAIVYQQISVHAGAAIMARLRALVGDVVPGRFMAVGEEPLRRVGLSRMKVSYILDLAHHFEAGQLGPDVWEGLSDGDVLRALTGVRGIGPWTAKMFMMFHLMRPDICAPEDLGLRHAYATYYGGTENEAWQAMAEHGKRWSPFNTVAARVLWKARRNED